MPDSEWLGLHDLPAHTHAQVLGIRASTTGDDTQTNTGTGPAVDGPHADPGAAPGTGASDAARDRN